MAGTDKKFLEAALTAVRQTENDGPIAGSLTEELSGLSGEKTVGLIQRLVRIFDGDDRACYLEIGVYHGLTLVSAARAAPGLPCFGIDNFTTLDPKGENKRIANERIQKLAADNVTLIDSDFEAALEGLDAQLLGRKIGVYFIDGPHDYRSQMVCLLAAKRFLHDNVAIIVDDANYADVRHANRDFLIGHPDIKLLFEAYGPAHPANLAAAERERRQKGWLNGVNVLVRDSDDLLTDMLPPVDDDRTLYFNEWLVHRLRRAELAPEAVGMADAIALGDEQEEAKARAALLEKHAGLKGATDGRFPDRNTGSAGLTEGKLNTLRG